MNAPLRWRLALTFTVGLALMLFVGAAVFAVILERAYREDFDRELLEVAHAASDLYAIDREEYPTRDQAVSHVVSELLLGERTTIAFDTTGQRLAVSRHLPGSPDLDHIDPFATPTTPIDITTAGRDMRVVAVQLPDGVRLLVGQPNASFRARIGVLRVSLAVGLPLLLLLGGAIGVVLARPALKPVNAVATAAETAGEAVLRGDPRLPRLTLPRADDEVRQLTDAFNGLLDQLETALERERGFAEMQRAFLADAAHELRTPAAIVRSEADAALAAPEDVAGARDALRRVADEAGRMGQLITDLLLLARGDADRPFAMTPLYLDDLAEQSLRRIRALPIAAGREVRLGPFEATAVLGDPPLLERAIVALLENALVHGGAGLIELGVSPHEGHAILSVRDHGAGVPMEARERIFSRFARLDTDRPGTGLGLAIARLIATRHGGSLHVEEAHPGARFVMTLPMAPRGDTIVGSTP